MNLSTATGPRPSGHAATVQAMFDRSAPLHALHSSQPHAADNRVNAGKSVQSPRPPVVITFKRPTLHLKADPAR